MAKRKIKNMKKGSTKISRREQNDRLTNWYLINLCWGIVGILALFGIKEGYSNTATIGIMQPLMWVLTGVFAVLAVGLFCVHKVVKKGVRTCNYSKFMVACTLVSLWLALYNKIRPVMESVAQSLLNNPALTIGSYWNVWLPMIGIAGYLIVAFVWLAVKVTRK